MGDAKAREEKGVGVISAALQKYKKMAWEDNLAAWKLWIPCNTVNYMFVPMHLRIPFMSVISFAYCVILSRMHSEDAKSDAKELFESLPDLKDADLLKLLDINFKRFADDKGTLGQKEFSELMGQFGVSNEQVISSLFQIMRPSTENQRVHVSSASTLLFTLAGKGSPDEHLKSIFDACDLEFDGKLHRYEVKQTLLSLLRMREELLIARTELDSPMVMFALPAKREEPVDIEELEFRKQKRFKFLKNRSDALYGTCESTDAILELEAEQLTKNVFKEAYISADNSPPGQDSVAEVISQEEFNAWASNSPPSKTSKEFFRLFDAFKSFSSNMQAGVAEKRD